MTGKLYVAVFRYFNKNTHRTEFKKRPFLIIGKADSSDYIALPVSRVTQRQHLDSFYDYEIDPVVYPKASLDAKSYIRTHKQIILRREELTKEISDFKMLYPDDFDEIMQRVASFQEYLFIQSQV